MPETKVIYGFPSNSNFRTKSISFCVLSLRVESWKCVKQFLHYADKKLTKLFYICRLAAFERHRCHISPSRECQIENPFRSTNFEFLILISHFRNANDRQYWNVNCKTVYWLQRKTFPFLITLFNNHLTLQLHFSIEIVRPFCRFIAIRYDEFMNSGNDDTRSQFVFFFHQIGQIILKRKNSYEKKRRTKNLPLNFEFPLFD